MESKLKKGDVLNDTYRLMELIGRGGMGEVWKAQHERLPKQVAVKVLLDATLAHETSLARFRREAEIASRLGHPNIVEVLDFNTLPGGVPYMVLELLHGESLRDRLKRGTLDLAKTVRILRQVASALEEAHRMGVVHRDLKPENIHLCPEKGENGPTERAKVLDFGISKIQGGETALTCESEVLGTPVYMAPEQVAARHGSIDGRTDQFALATIAYEMLSGSIAFGGHSVIQILGKILEGSPPPLREVLPGVSEQVAAAVDRALSKKSEDRFESVTDFVDALAADLKADGQSTEPVGTAATIQSSFSQPSKKPPSQAEAAIAPTMASSPGSAQPEPAGPAQSEPAASPSADLAVMPTAHMTGEEGAGAVNQQTGPGSSDPKRGSKEGLHSTSPSAPRPSEGEPGDSERQQQEPLPSAGIEEVDGGRQREGQSRALLTLLTVAGVLVMGAAIGVGIFWVLRGDDSSEDRRSAQRRKVTVRTPAGERDADPAKTSPPTRPRSADGGARATDLPPDRRSGRANDMSPPRPPRSDENGRRSRNGGREGRDGGRAHGRPTRERPHRPRKSDLPPQAAQKLAQAKRALASGSYGRAAHLAEQSIGAHPNQKAYSIAVKAYCAQKRLGKAKARFRNVYGRSRKRRLIRFCKRYEMYVDSP
jgi:serine/threonine-protein kinase